MSRVIILSDDGPLLNRLARITSSIQNIEVTSADLTIDSQGTLRSADANTVIVLAITQEPNIRILSTIAELIQGAPSIFISHLDDTESYEAASAINADVLIMGDFTDTAFQYNIERQLENPSMDTWKIIDGKTIHLLDKQKIEWVRTEGNYSTISCDKRITTVRKPLKQIEEEIQSSKLLKIHRSVLINTRYIAALRVADNEIQMKDGETLPIGRSFKKTILEYDFN